MCIVYYYQLFLFTIVGLEGEGIVLKMSEKHIFQDQPVLKTIKSVSELESEWVCE